MSATHEIDLSNAVYHYVDDEDDLRTVLEEVDTGIIARYVRDNISDFQDELISESCSEGLGDFIKYAIQEKGLDVREDSECDSCEHFKLILGHLESVVVGLQVKHNLSGELDTVIEVDNTDSDLPFKLDKNNWVSIRDVTVLKPSKELQVKEVFEGVQSAYLGKVAPRHGDLYLCLTAEANSTFTEGKVYPCLNGKLVDDNNHKRSTVVTATFVRLAQVDEPRPSSEPEYQQAMKLFNQMDADIQATFVQELVRRSIFKESA